MNNRITLPLLIITFFSFLPAQPQTRSVRHVKTITFHDNSAKKKSVTSFLLGTKKTKIVKPGALCRVNSALLCVCDAVNGSVLFVDREGNIKKSITHVKGIKLISPVSACSDDRGSLYIADSTQGGIIRFSASLKFVDIFIAAREWRITGIIFSGGLFFCVDTQGHQALCFDRSGRLSFSFGKRGTGQGEFNYPTHITADNDNIYITDAMNFRVQVFDHQGRFIRAIGCQGRGGGQFSKPKGIAVNRDQLIFVADVMFDNIQVFNLKGEFLTYFGSPGQQDGQFRMPSGLLVDEDDTIWVADTYNQRIQVFKVTEDST